jgi:hypothetical protein
VPAAGYRSREVAVVAEIVAVHDPQFETPRGLTAEQLGRQSAPAAARSAC